MATNVNPTRTPSRTRRRAEKKPAQRSTKHLYQIVLRSLSDRRLRRSLG